MWTRIALYAVLGYTLDAMDAHWDSWGFWCVLGLFIANEHLTRTHLIEQLQEELARMRAERKEKQ